ncbi:MAG: glycyl radical protein [Clostridiales bacterium]|jgi:formate C-acetyltransferase|nr:glycyl radical protein [Clostridiales bacterium]
MEKKYSIEKPERVTRLTEDLYKNMPEIEPARALLITESYKKTEGQPLIIRRAEAFSHILSNIPIIIRDGELIVGSSTIAPRGCQTYPEYSFEWLEEEFDTVEHRKADPFYISGQTKLDLKSANTYWKGKTTSELAEAYMSPEAKKAMAHNIFTPGNYYYNGIGHITVEYEKILEIGFNGIIEEAQKEIAVLNVGDMDYAKRHSFLKSVIISCESAINYALRYSELAAEMAGSYKGTPREAELIKISEVCKNSLANGVTNFYGACQCFWFTHQLIQLESSGHSISPGRFDQYMYPYYKSDIDKGAITKEFAQELIDCIWIKLNDLNKCRDAASAEGFAGYSLFQNLIVGGQDEDGLDVTNDLSFMCIEASIHVFLPQPSLSVRVWNGSPHELLVKAAELTRTGIGLPAYYNDEVIIPSLMNRGLTLKDARTYNIIGCVEPQKAGKTDGWHDAAFFNMCRPLELVFSNGSDKGELISIETGGVESFDTFEKFYNAYKSQMSYNISLLVNAINSIDTAHCDRCPLPFLSSMVNDCIKRGKSVQEGGALYNFSGPQGFGVANVADSLYAIKKLVYEDKKITLAEFKQALGLNYGKDLYGQAIPAIIAEVAHTVKNSGQEFSEKNISGLVASIINSGGLKEINEKYETLLTWIDELPKYGNDIADVDFLARDAAYTYTKPLEHYKNPRGGIFQAGLYPVSANVPLGAQTGATPDGRLAGTPIADGVSPSAGKDVNGPTASANSVARLDHGIASNGTLFNMKFHPSALTGEEGLNNFVAFIRSYFDQKGSHLQFNVVDRATLLDAQQHPENYKHLIVRVAGYSALFTTLSRPLQDDIISRTEQGI